MPVNRVGHLLDVEREELAGGAEVADQPLRPEYAASSAAPQYNITHVHAKITLVFQHPAKASTVIEYVQSALFEHVTTYLPPVVTTQGLPAISHSGPAHDDLSTIRKFVGVRFLRAAAAAVCVISSAFAIAAVLGSQLARSFAYAVPALLAFAVVRAAGAFAKRLRPSLEL